MGKTPNVLKAFYYSTKAGTFADKVCYKAWNKGSRFNIFISKINEFVSFSKRRGKIISLMEVRHTLLVYQKDFLETLKMAKTVNTTDKSNFGMKSYCDLLEIIDEAIKKLRVLASDWSNRS